MAHEKDLCPQKVFLKKEKVIQFLSLGPYNVDVAVRPLQVITDEVGNGVQQGEHFKVSHGNLIVIVGSVQTPYFFGFNIP